LTAAAPFSWKKLGQLFDPTTVTGRPWMREFAQGPATVLFDSHLRVYFSCRPLPDEQGRYVSYSAFVDLDRRDLFRILRIAERPVLELGEPGTFDEFGTYPFSVARDGGGYVAYYGGWTRCGSVPFDVAIGCARSTDGGETFRRVGPGPVLGAFRDEPFVLSGPKIRRFEERWFLFYIAGRKWKVVDGRPEPVYRIRLAISEDGLAWERHGQDLIASRIEDDEAQASPDVFFSNGAYHMFFCYRYSAAYRSKERGYRIGYAQSTDLRAWTRDDARAGIDVSAEGWDSQMVSYPHVFALDGKTYMLYLGNDVGRRGFGLAELVGELA
jgi:hypothetical protein